MNYPQLSKNPSISLALNVEFDIYSHQAPLKHGLLHSILNAFYLPYRLGNREQMVEDFHVQLIDQYSDSYYVAHVATMIDKTIFVTDLLTFETEIFNDSTVGSIWLSHNMGIYQLLGIIENDELVTIFGSGHILIKTLHKKINFKAD
jgi:hypothetical protein